MRSFFYFIFIALLLIILEATLFRSITRTFFGFIGFKYFSMYCLDTAFMLAVYIALTRKFFMAFLCAFVLGYFKDLLVISNAWLSPFIFVVCILVAGVLKKMVLLKGAFPFSVFMFFMSIFSTLLWMILTNYLFSNQSAFMIGLYSMLPNAIVNTIFSFLLYPIIEKLDFFVEGDDSTVDRLLSQRW